MALTSGRDDRPRTAAVLIACALVLAPTLSYRFGVDQANFAYMAAELLHGYWPYLHTWDNQFPGLVLLQAAEILLFGKSVAMFRVFDLMFQLGNAYLIFRIANRLSGRAAALIAAVLFCLIYQGYGPWNTGQREGFGLLFVLAGFWMYFTADRRSPVLTAAAIGLGLGIAVTIKPTLLALVLFYVPLVTELRGRRALALAAVAAAGLAVPAAAITIWYWEIGGLVQLYEACVAFQAVYTSLLRGQEPLLAYWIQKLGHFGLNAVALPIVYAPFLLWRTARRERLMVWLGYLGSLYAVFVQGTFAGYHYLPGLALGAILVGSLFSLASDRLVHGLELSRGTRRVPAKLVLAQALLVAAALFYMRDAPIENLVTLQFLNRPAANEFRNQTVFDFTESYDVAAYIRERTRRDQPIQVWGYESLIYYLADRRAASRFQTAQPLVLRVLGEDLTPMQRRWRAEFLNDMERRPPVYVAVVRRDNWWWAPGEQTSEELLDDVPEWKGIIEREYMLEYTIGRFLIYRRLTG